MTVRLPEFSDLPFNPALLQGLDAFGHVQMTPIQAQGLPALLEGRDLVAQAPTGSGKTAQM
jgi:ATP-independent RNA helicase DbpA